MRGASTYIVKYFIGLRISFHEAVALTGFVLFMTIYFQILSGIAISFSFAPEVMNIALSREEEDSENMFTDDFFYLHERGVDFLELFLIIHLVRKLYLSVSDIEQEFAWKSGALMFIFLQAVVFTGLVLCTTHLSDVTLVIASNIVRTLTLFTGKLYWLIFTDQTINTDTLIRMSYAHFVLGCFAGVISIYHGVDMHYDWKAEYDFESLNQQIDWFDEALTNELATFIEIVLIMCVICLYLFVEPEAVSYELFMWGDVGMITDVRFFGVAPHWYFRPYMAWLLVCPFHFIGIFGLIFFFISFYFQTNIVSKEDNDIYQTFKLSIINFLTNTTLYFKRLPRIYRPIVDMEYNYFFTYVLFLVCWLYAFSYLPYGRFYHRIGGNDATLIAFAYIYIYLSGLYFREPALLNARKGLVY